MPKYTAIPVQEVGSERNVLLTDVICCNRGNVLHSNGSGLLTLRGLTNQCFARYRVSFNANVAIPATGTAGEIGLSLSVNGEALESATAVVTPGAVSEYWNVSCADLIDVPRGCCVTLAVTNTAGQTIDVRNGTLLIERIA